MTSNSDFFDGFNESTKAKLDIYKAYIVRYLNVLKMAFSRYGNGKNTVYIADLFAGPGKDENGNPGSPSILLDYISQTYLQGLNLNICFNEANAENADKLERFVKNHKAYKQPGINIDVQRKKYEDLLPLIKKKHQNISYYKRFFFLDPFGYKEIHLADIRDVLDDGNTELLLFLPVSFIYRFKSRDDIYKPIKAFLSDFVSTPIDNIVGNDRKFIQEILHTLRIKLDNIFVDSFIIQDNSGKGHNCLIYFSRSRKGLEKFVEAKWEIDKNEGSGYDKINATMESFLETFYKDALKNALTNYLKGAKKDNIEIRNFCYENGFLPRHGTAVLQQLNAVGAIRLSPYNNRCKIRNNCFYLTSDKEQKIFVEFKENENDKN